MITKSTTGWLPIEMGLDPQPAVVQEALVRWMEFGATPLAEPFMSHTVDRLRRETPPAREIDTDLETMMRLSSRLPAVRPTGFIFHVSHCGSTLIANALKTSDRAVVVSESRPVSALLRPVSPRSGAFLTARWDGMRRNLLESLFSLFAHYRTGEAEPLIVKFVSIDMLSIGLVRSFWPDVPCVVVIRDPVEVMVTSLQTKGWMGLKDIPDAAAILFGWTDPTKSTVDMVNEEFCARILGSLCTSALESVDANCMVVDYVDVSPAKMREIADFFGISLPADGRAVDEVFRPYAKDPAKKARFQDDRERKQKVASIWARGAATQWASGPYSALRSRRQRSAAGARQFSAPI